MSGPNDKTGPESNACFTTTHWSVVLAAGEEPSPQAAEALEILCRTYWYPLYAYIRRRGHTPEDAQDLTQGFFAQLLRKNYPARADRAKGKFRTFLLHALNQFLADQRERATTLKRGGGKILISLDKESPEDRYRLDIADELTPEKLFERRWAQTLLDRALDSLREEFVTEGKEAVYEVLQTFEPGEQSPLSYADAAIRLGVSESAVKFIGCVNATGNWCGRKSRIPCPLWLTLMKNCATWYRCSGADPDATSPTLSRMYQMELV